MTFINGDHIWAVLGVGTAWHFVEYSRKILLRPCSVRYAHYLSNRVTAGSLMLLLLITSAEERPMSKLKGTGWSSPPTRIGGLNLL